MINLAGVETCDETIRVELETAGVDIVEHEQTPPRNEVPYKLSGKLGPFTFRRLWYYWSVRGEVPLAVAKELYAHPDGAKAVRVAGHCGCPPPDRWMNRNGCVDCYHIDTQEGLNLFVETVRKHGLVD